MKWRVVLLVAVCLPLYACHAPLPDPGGSAIPRPLEPLPNQRPYPLYAVSNAEPVTGEPVTFDGRLARDPDGHVVAWLWFLGTTPIQSGSTMTLTFPTPASVVVALQVTDNEGLAAMGSTEIRITEPDPGGCGGGGCR